MKPRVLGFNYTATVTLEPQPFGLLKPVINVKPEDLAHDLVSYWRWCAEGKLPYQGNWSQDKRPPQYYYDNHHHHIEFHPDTDDYSFRVQIGDGPDGDTWLSGRFKFSNGSGIVITEKKTGYY